MERTKYALYGEYSYVSNDALENTKFHLRKEEHEEMNRKMKEAFSNTRFETFGDRAGAEKAFIWGYLAAHIEYPAFGDKS